MSLRYYGLWGATTSKRVNGMIYAIDLLVPVQSFPASG